MQNNNDSKPHYTLITLFHPQTIKIKNLKTQTKRLPGEKCKCMKFTWKK